ncbi:MAG TPA: D-aminoacylase [Gemmatimonadales bacterium]|nr:D-aminoacylase [Gemmatimonadales bacterium]
MTTRRDFVSSTGLGLAALGLPALRLQSATAYDLIIRGAAIYGAPGELSTAGKEMDVAVSAGRIVKVGRKFLENGREEIDGRGLALAPGFIDIHSHADGNLTDDPRAESVIRQGVTTVVVGQDGGSHVPAKDGTTSFRTYFKRVEALPSAVNVASMVGLGQVREIVVGEDNRPATPKELVRMTALVEKALASGACGASTGLEYSPGAFASREELIALCRPLRARRLPYATHMRNEDDTLIEAIDEAVAIARGARCPLQISHLKTAGARNWNKIDAVFARIAAAEKAGLDVTFDRYPYVAWSTGLTNMFPVWALDGGDDAFLKRLTDSATAERVRTESADKAAMIGGWHNVQLSNVAAPGDSDAVGKRLDDWGRTRGLEPYDAAVRLLQNSTNNVSTVVFAMSEENLERFLAHPKCMICSDGGSFALTGAAREGHPHPRGLGTFPRVLGRYVRERKVITLAQAVDKMSGMPARRLRLSGRGKIAPGAWADLVLFDPATVADTATFEDPFQYPVGIPTVVVNGKIALRDGERVGVGNGKALRK